MDRIVKAVLLSDFNLDNLAASLAHDETSPVVHTRVAPFGQVQAVLMDAGHDIWNEESDVALVWTQPQAISPTFASRLTGAPGGIEEILSEVDAFASSLEQLQSRVPLILLPLWVRAQGQTMSGMLDLDARSGISRAVSAMNERLLSRTDGLAQVVPLDAMRWLSVSEPKAFSPKLWYMAKVPFAPGVFTAAVADVKSALRGLAGATRKLVVLDLDNTLWGGMVGELGWEELKLGGHDAAGEAYVDFQRALKTLQQRGILLAVVSKNEEDVALAAIQNHPEMVLQENDLCGWRINWNDKAENIRQLVEDLNLGLQSVVFLDDSPVERARVREALPEVLVPELPRDPMLYTSMLFGLDCFNVPTISDEDRNRTAMYRTEQSRNKLKGDFASLDQWLMTLETEIQVEQLSESNLVRAAQLFNKTNQFNLATRRMSQQELVDWSSQANRSTWTFRVKDKLGDSGLTGLASLEVDGTTGVLVDLLLSCRVMGRKVEEVMMHVILDHARSLRLETVEAQFVATVKNKPCLRWLEARAKPVAGCPLRFFWRTDADSPVPAGITLRMT